MNTSIALLVALGLSANPAAEKSARKARGTLLQEATVFFAVGSTEIGDVSKEALDTAAKTIKKRASRSNLLIVGHTDARGSEDANRRLSGARAAEVRRGLIERGVDPALLSVLGVGASEPLVPEDSDEALQKNRRVEFWVTSAKPVAHVTWIKKDVEARDPEAQWTPADLDMALMRQFQVRTLERSASEVTFLRESKLYLGESALVVIYDNSKASPRARLRVADVTIEAGSVFARLAAAEKQPLEVETPSARVKVQGEGTRLGYDKESGNASVAVYEGKAEVTAEGQSVQVPKNHGTRVKRGKPPEPPRPLPFAPAWDVDDPVLAQGGAGMLHWKLRVGTSSVQVELAEPDDVAFERPIRSTAVKGRSMAVDGIEAGLYRVRLSSIDERGLIGPPGPPIKLVVVPSPTGLGLEIPLERGVAQMPGPGRFVQPGGSGFGVLLGPADAPMPDGVDLLAIGKHKIPYRVMLEGGAMFAGGALAVLVPPLRISVAPPTPELEGEVSHTSIRLKVVGAAGHLIPGLELLVHRVDQRLPGVAAMQQANTGDTEGELMKCESCTWPDGAPLMQDEGNGYYRFDYVRRASTGFRRDLVRVVERRTKLMQEVEVPIGAIVYEAPPKQRSGFVAALKAGAQVADEEALAFRVNADLGLRLHLFGPLSLEAGGQLGYFRTPARTLSEDSRVDVFPLLGRGLLDLDFGGGGLYGGAAAGVGLMLSPIAGSGAEEIAPVQFFFHAFAGAFVTAGPGDIVAEATVFPLGLAGTDARANLGPSVVLGYRVRPWIDDDAEKVDVRESDRPNDFLDVADSARGD